MSSTQALPPLAERAANGKLMCRACKRSVGELALWGAHCSSKIHRDALLMYNSIPIPPPPTSSTPVVPPPPRDALPTKSFVGAGAGTSTSITSRTGSSVSDEQSTGSITSSSGGRTDKAHHLTSDPPTLTRKTTTTSTSTTTTSSASLPTGFYDNADADARAHGKNPALVAKEAAAAEFATFMNWAKGVVEVEEKERTVDEDTRYAERGISQRVEDALYRARVDVVKSVRDHIHSSSSSSSRSNGNSNVNNTAVNGGAKASATTETKGGRWEGIGTVSSSASSTSVGVTSGIHRDDAAAAKEEEDNDDELDSDAEAVAHAELLGPISFLTSVDEGATRVSKKELRALIRAQRRTFAAAAAAAAAEVATANGGISTKRKQMQTQSAAHNEASSMEHQSLSSPVIGMVGGEEKEVGVVGVGLVVETSAAKRSKYDDDDAEGEGEEQEKMTTPDKDDDGEDEDGDNLESLLDWRKKRL